ncbi:EF2563 family selenium-dependent molybdenum hydroxylase system protein [Romboutsia ilealis]|uniref:EF2563 family selenium-dependent molybdenum hydroxylase system protein n=1 Tax=Romboutsia faecis TaxID=2764597 RepID=A0ABR7JQN1_9FIRM|nr:selenium-dependent molybdenum cofactor biosynthesis protein YqeB [Romboutsia faecis]MBC5996921.1 EF2563 family selenium-dependent molybdenum hydroxylase system protein [Romboutsia faecis]MRN24577.1 EF2563 family selenium-dependent molybdenum hydroxylase system protein [Romboutsia ilealis]
MNNIILVRGAGDLASAVIHKLHMCGFKVVALEIEKPLAIRRQVAFCEAVYEGEVEIEGVSCKLCNSISQVKETLKINKVALYIDPKGESIKEINPKVVVDCILAKKNIGTNRDMADLTIGLGPGFCAGEDVDIVIETMRGHNLGRVIRMGKPKENTGIPGEINGVSKDRVVYSQVNGIISILCDIGDIVKKNQVLAYIEDNSGNKHEVLASIDGLLRGIIRDGAYVKSNLKILDIDPRLDQVKNAFTISDKGRNIAGGVLEAILSSKILPKY